MSNQCKVIIALVLVFILGIGIGYSVSSSMYEDIVKAKVQELKER
jgi:hypothetical protein